MDSDKKDSIASQDEGIETIKWKVELPWHDLHMLHETDSKSC
jgi:hypothetical protein